MVCVRELLSACTSLGLGVGGTLGFATRTLGTQLSLYQSLGQLNFAILYWTKLPKSPPVLE